MFRFARSYRGGLKAVILDWAGTTQDHGCRAPAGVFVDVFRKNGVEITMAQAREPMGTPKRDHLARIAANPEVAAAWHQRHGRPCGAADIDRMYAEFIPLQLECLPTYADLIPGTLEAAAAFRSRGLVIGSTTGYNLEMTEIVRAEARKRGFVPDACVCASDVPAGRPAPWMCLVAAMRLGVYPLEAIVKIGDTIPDIEEGLNAGMWTIGVARTGNEIGLSLAELARVPADRLATDLAKVHARMYQAGAHYVVDSIGDCDPILDEIERRLRAGQRP